MFVMNECSIDLPTDWHDQSINVVSSNSPMAPGLTMTVTRDDLPFGMKFDEYLEEQIDQVSKSMIDFKLLARKTVLLDGVEATELECNWLAKDIRMHQIIYMMPTPQGRAMVVTASMPGNMTASQGNEVRRMVQTVRFRRG